MTVLSPGTGINYNNEAQITDSDQDDEDSDTDTDDMVDEDGDGDDDGDDDDEDEICLVVDPAPIICDGASLDVDLSILFGENANGATFDWVAVNNVNVSGETLVNTNSSTITDLLVNTTNSSQIVVYNVDITPNPHGCVGLVTVIVNPTPIADAGADDILTCASNTLILDGTNSSGVGSLTYSWSTSGSGNIVSGETTASPTIDAPGTYTLVITDSNGCSDSDEVIITQDTSVPNADAGIGGELSCTTTSFILDGSGSTGQNTISYLWVASGGGNIVSGETTANPTIDAPGTYTLTVTDTDNDNDNDNGCTDSDSVTITEDIATPSVNIEQTSFCAGDIILNENGGDAISWNWSGPAGFNSTDQSPSILNADNSNAGLYSVTVTGSNGCTNVASSTISITEITNIQVSQLCTSTVDEIYDIEICFDAFDPGSCGSFDINVGLFGSYGPFNYTDYLESGDSYCLTISDPILFDASNEESNIQVEIIDCNSTLLCSGSTSYDEVSCPNFDLALIKTISTPGPYYPGDLVTFNIDVFNQGEIDAYDINIIDILPSSLLFSLSDNTSVQTGNAEDWTIVGANPTYIIDYLAAGDPQTPLTIAINLQIDPGATALNIVNNATIISAEDVDNNPANDEDSAIDGTTPNVEDEINDEMADDSSGETGAGGFPIVDDPTDVDHFDFEPIFICLGSVSINSNSPICLGDDLMIDAIVMNDSPPTSFSWTGPNGFVSNMQNIFISSPSLLESGIYTVVVTDMNGCTDSESVNFIINDLPAAIAESNSPVCEGSILELMETGGDAVSWLWNGPNGFNSILQNPTTGTGSGTYFVTVTDINNCTNSASVDVIVNPVPLASASSNGPICAGEILMLFENGGSATMWSWSGPNGYNSTDQNPIVDPSTVDNNGIYTVVVTDANNCTSSATVDVVVDPSPILNVSPCICDYDPNIGNIGSMVTFSVSSGSGPYNVTTTNGTLSNTILVAGQIATLYLGGNGGSYTLEVSNSLGCITSYSGSCDPCIFEPAELTDPCSCNNDQSYNGSQDGTFEEVVEITGPPGLNLIIGAGSSGIINASVGDPIPEIIPGLYRISFDHYDLVGFTMYVEGIFNGIVFPILDVNGNQLFATNVCQYPVITEPDIDITAFCNNGEPLVFSGDEVIEINGFPGIVRVYVGTSSQGTLINEFDPTDYANGFYTLTFEFTGTFVDNISTGAVPAFPGCSTFTTIEIGVGGGGTMACNDHINVSVNNDCVLDFSWSTLLENDYVPDVFNAIFEDSAGNVIEEEDLGDYAGSDLTYIIMDMCNGNKCWGTIHIDDKSIPEVQCDCPVGGEDLDGDGIVDGYSEDCTLTCWELPLLKERYWDRLRDDLVPEMADDFIDDNTSSICDDITEDDVSYYDVYVDLGPCNGSLLRRTWTLAYDKGNGVEGTVSCTREYYFKTVGLETLDTARIDPATGAIVIAPDSLILPFPLVVTGCGADISPAGIAAYFDDPGSVDQDTDDDNIDPDELDIDCVIESNEGVPFAYPHYYVEGRNPSGPHAQAINTEICNIIVGYTDNEIDACAPGCDGNRKVLRNWTVLDWCSGQFIEYGQIIKSIDTGNPSLVVHDLTVSVDSWKCAADVLLPHPEHIYDDCDDNMTYWIGSVEGALTVSGDASSGYVLHDSPEGETITVEYVTEDCCGNRGNAYADITVVDLTPPVPVTKEFIVLSLTNIGNPVDEFQGIAKLFAVDVDNGSYDGCTGIDMAVRRVGDVCDLADLDWGDAVKFCCEDLDGQAFVEIDVEFRVRDAYGNTNYAWTTVRLEDKSATTQTCPPDLVLTCDMDYNDFTMTGLPRVFSACGEIDIMCDPEELIEDTEPRRKGPNDGFFNDPRYDGVEVPAYDPSCGYGAVRRQFKSCSSCTQWFVIEPIDAFDPSSISWPADQVVDCDQFDPGEPYWNPATCNLVGVSMESDTSFNFEDGACWKVLNHWSIINWCTYDPTNPNSGGRYNYTQIIKLIDTQDPVLTVADSLCFGVDVTCSSAGVQMSGSGNDEGPCGSDWLKWEVTIDLNSDWTSDYYFGTNLPRLVNGSPNPYYIAPTGNDELATITLPDGIASSKQWHRAVWRLYDGCGNNVSSVRYFQVTDKKAPTPYCLNLSTAVMSGNGQVELWAIDFNVGSFDNCTANDNLWFTFSDVAPPGRDDTEYDSSSDLVWYNGTFWYYDPETGEYQDQDDYFDGDAHRWEPGLRSAGKIFTIDDADASGFAQIPIYVWDECGNADFCLVNLRLIDNMGVGEGRIAGQVITEEGAGVEGVMTQLMSNAPEYPYYNATNTEGEYAFNGIEESNDYEVSGTKTDDYLNGVSTLDLLLIQRHILGQELLSSPYKMIAADINSDDDITAIDMIELRKLILGVYSELPSNASWKLVDSDQVLTVDNPWIYKSDLQINDLDGDMTTEDFIGVKIGDVNGSVKANLKAGEDQLSGQVMEMKYEDRYVELGQDIEIEMRSGVEGLYGYQFTMDMSGFELVEIIGEDIENGNVARFLDKVTMSYHTLEARGADEHLFTLVMRAKESGQISDMIGVNSSVTAAEAYVGESLEIVQVDMRGKEEGGRFALYQNKPNPFSEYTMIGYELPQRGEVRISFYDVTGKVLTVIEKDSEQGYNEIRVNRTDLGISGMIYYKLESREHTATQHMMMIE